MENREEKLHIGDTVFIRENGKRLIITDVFAISNSFLYLVENRWIPDYQITSVEPQYKVDDVVKSSTYPMLIITRSIFHNESWHYNAKLDGFRYLPELFKESDFEPFLVPKPKQAVRSETTVAVLEEQKKQQSAYSELKMQLPKGHKEFLSNLIDMWEITGIKNLPSVHNGCPSMDYDNVIIHYTDVAILVEVIRDYAYKMGHINCLEQIFDSDKDR